jgi:hypothetical protein
MAGGLIEFDGRQFKEITVGAARKRLPGINHLSKLHARLYVCTFADGLWMQEGARWIQLTVADGLLSNRIVGVVASRENLFVASDYGLSVAPFNALSLEVTKGSPQSFRSIAILPTLSGMIDLGRVILLCKDNGESFALPAVEDLGRLPQVNPLVWNRPINLTGSRLMILDRDIWLTGSDGVRRAQAEAVEASGRRTPLSFSPFGHTDDASALTTNLISALTVDAWGRLWAGGFRDGIDVFTPSARRLAHLESEDAREINFLTRDGEAKAVLAATSQGLLRFDANLRASAHWSQSDGLLSSSVMQVAEMSAGGATEDEAQQRPQKFAIVCATSKGLSLAVPGGGWRGLTTVQGLPSNSLYTVLLQGRRIYAGTLGGLALVEDGRVVRVFTDTNSSLTHNWVTALSLSGSRLFVGTYGGGVFELTPAGELHGFQAETGRAVVNPNAMWSDGARLYVGTLDGALVLNLQSQKWTRLVRELPARTVLSITGDDKYTYFGTTSGIIRVERAYWERLE